MEAAAIGEADRGAHGSCKRLDLHLSWSVISGAGKGTCEVMVQALARPIRHARNGKLVSAAPVGKPQDVSFFDGLKHGIELGLPEAFLFHKSLGVMECSTIVSTRPAMPRFVFWLTHSLTRIGVFRPRWVRAILRIAFRIVRVGILKQRSTALEIVAHANSSIESNGIVKRVRCDDAFQSAAEVVSSCMKQLNGTRPPPGIYTADKLFTIDQILEDCPSITSQESEQSDCG